ncbi:MAG: pyridoxamine 5'-phosphate oxidase family protein [Actinomycetota bacterium]|nr:pyridoxamine 5'-phosphate oxidase family protein [Actinomycetota bacterium]
MAAWGQIETEAPELAALARQFFDAEVHKTIATLRRDGSPRISGTEAKFENGELTFGSMWKATKALDLLRDPRFALHSTSIATGWKGDAKVAGRAEEITEPERKKAEAAPPGEFHLFRADISELVVVRLGDPADHLVIEAWHEGRGLTSTRR